MKRKLILTISILMICFMTSCKNFNQIKDTNGPDDYTLNTITDEDIMKMVADAIKNEKEKSMSDSNEIKDKFKSEINDYLERMQDYL